MLPEHDHASTAAQHSHGHAIQTDPTARGADPREAAPSHGRAVRIGLGGPVGSGKTALTTALCRALGTGIELGVVTNDIYTTQDADYLRSAGVLDTDRIEAVQTGACPHTAIRDDITANLDAVERLQHHHPGLRLVLVESGGDNLTAVFSRGLVDAQIFVVDVAGGDKVPSKGGPGVTTADLLVINKIDLAEHVGADMRRMVADAHRMRGERPVITQSLTRTPDAPDVASWVREQLAADAVGTRQ